MLTCRDCLGTILNLATHHYGNPIDPPASSSRRVERSIRLWRAHGTTWEWEVTTWRGSTWLTRSTGLADSEAAARTAALAYQAAYSLRAPIGAIYGWSD